MPSRTAATSGDRSSSQPVSNLSTAAMFDLYDRRTPWFEVLRGECASVRALQEAERRFWDDIQGLYSQALGSLAGDRLVYGTVIVRPTRPRSERCERPAFRSRRLQPRSATSWWNS
jgi:hypothetical protein